MPARKLTNSETQQIPLLYRQSGETTATLAERFNVSNSTISRILKEALDPDEYKALSQQKRAEGKSNRRVTSPTKPAVTGTLATPPSGNPPPLKRRSTATDLPQPVNPSSSVQLALLEDKSASAIAPQTAAKSEADLMAEALEVLQDVGGPAHRRDAIAALASDLEADESDLEDEAALVDLGDLEIEDDEDEFDDEDDEDDEDAFDQDDGDLDVAVTLKPEMAVQVLPFTDATIPAPFYLVVDRLSELITRPLREFGELGKIPEAEANSRILPIFENHRIARRFSRKNQRIIKVPDAHMLHKTKAYLTAKGINRLLIDGQLYGL
ncbi:hypothetical protein OOK60_14015 [Trichothermofontia sichuanensis B231]|uniref:hypothetical protein n=1 Tax=Trichothermofontia sichuanensis TaxID=3045816 RepID=UPI002245ABBF|nr:hypothetical protein [Trichothermofontia sichuanensis]UZQ53604.1 hypothetical protein OOK60_14015 [Trichothermofontia sichuanensis B231]